MDVVATHEFGHVLGLLHSQRCATMDAPTDMVCNISNNNGNKYICDLLPTDDVRGAVALYGGGAHRYTPQTCDYLGQPVAPIGLTASLINADPDTGYLGDIQISFRAPTGKAAPGIEYQPRCSFATAPVVHRQRLWRRPKSKPSCFPTLLG